VVMLEVGEHVGQDLQERGLLFVHRDEAVELAAIPTTYTLPQKG
jgi:hypothetical protein